MPRKTISVLTTNYNHGRYIAQSIRSVLSQTRKPDQYIVLDDGSTDDSVEIIRSFGSDVTLMENERNEGAMRSTQKVMDRVTSDYFYGLGADDYALPCFVEKCMDELERNPQAGLCFSDHGWDRHGVHQNTKLNIGPAGYYGPRDLARLMRVSNLWVAGHSSIMNRTLSLNAGGYLPSLRWHCDWFLLLVLCFRHGACYVPEVLSRMRILSDSYSATGRRDAAQQGKVVETIKSLLKTDYMDVADLFDESRCMRQVGA